MNTPSPEQIEQARPYHVVVEGDNLKRYRVMGPVPADGFHISRRDADAACERANAIHAAAHLQAQAAPPVQGLVDAGDAIADKLDAGIPAHRKALYAWLNEARPFRTDTAKASAPPAQPDRTGWVYEDQLPPMSKEAYHEWYLKSDVVHGVRMGPPVQLASEEMEEWQLDKDINITAHGILKLVWLTADGHTMKMTPRHWVRWNVNPKRLSKRLKKLFAAFPVSNGEQERSGPSVEDKLYEMTDRLLHVVSACKSSTMDLKTARQVEYAEETLRSACRVGSNRVEIINDQPSTAIPDDLQFGNTTSVKP